MTPDEQLKVFRSALDACKQQRFGEAAIELGVLTETQRDELLRLQESAAPRLGQILAELGILDPDRISEELEEYERERDSAASVEPNAGLETA